MFYGNGNHVRMINCKPDLPLEFDIAPFPLPAHPIQLDTTCALTTNASVHTPTQELQNKRAGLINSGKKWNFCIFTRFPVLWRLKLSSPYDIRVMQLWARFSTMASTMLTRNCRRLHNMAIAGVARASKTYTTHVITTTIHN